MLSKDMRRADRRWRSHSVWMRRLRIDWATHGWNWQWMENRPYPFRHSRLTKEAACSIWAQTTLCDCFWNPGFAGMGRFKDTPHPKCSSYECNPREYAHGQGSRPIQEWREEARAWGDEGREDYHVRRREPDRMILIRQTCICGCVMGKVWKRAEEISWSDKRSEKYCPSCEKRFGPRKVVRMPA